MFNLPKQPSSISKTNFKNSENIQREEFCRRFQQVNGAKNNAMKIFQDSHISSNSSFAIVDEISTDDVKTKDANYIKWNDMLVGNKHAAGNFSAKVETEEQSPLNDFAAEFKNPFR